MIHAYRVLSNLLYPIFVIFVYFRKLIKKEDPVRFKEKIIISHFNVKRDIECIGRNSKIAVRVAK